MQKTTKTSTVIEFFAAANGYDGFRSYFPEVFDSKNYDHIFILKGGPGTGKSSLMRAVYAFGSKNGYSCEKTLCSSDPHSLDGVILEKGKKRFAVLDGTAPHTRDADVPGAVDEIINLGENWNTDALIKNRSLISELNKRKKNNYALAYKHLGYAGEIEKLRNKLQEPKIRYNLLNSHIKSIAESIKKEERHGKKSTRLISSFGRFGKFDLKTVEQISQKTISIKNRGFVSVEYIKALEKDLEFSGTEMTAFPSVFDKNQTEAIFLPETKTAVILTDSEKTTVDPIEFCSNDTGVEKSEELSKIYSSLLDDAKKFFTFASDLHFELEKIYIGSMNFEKNEEFSERIIEKIKNMTE